MLLTPVVFHYTTRQEQQKAVLTEVERLRRRSMNSQFPFFRTFDVMRICDCRLRQAQILSLRKQTMTNVLHSMLTLTWKSQQTEIPRAPPIGCNILDLSNHLLGWFPLWMLSLLLHRREQLQGAGLFCFSAKTATPNGVMILLTSTKPLTSSLQRPLDSHRPLVEVSFYLDVPRRS